jgi:hypothetical protein
VRALKDENVKLKRELVRKEKALAGARQERAREVISLDDRTLQRWRKDRAAWVIAARHAYRRSARLLHAERRKKELCRVIAHIHLIPIRTIAELEEKILAEEVLPKGYEYWARK